MTTEFSDWEMKVKDGNKGEIPREHSYIVNNVIFAFLKCVFMNFLCISLDEYMNIENELLNCSKC